MAIEIVIYNPKIFNNLLKDLEAISGSNTGQLNEKLVKNLKNHLGAKDVDGLVKKISDIVISDNFVKLDSKDKQKICRALDKLKGEVKILSKVTEPWYSRILDVLLPNRLDKRLKKFNEANEKMVLVVKLEIEKTKEKEISEMNLKAEKASNNIYQPPPGFALSEKQIQFIKPFIENKDFKYAVIKFFNELAEDCKISEEEAFKNIESRSEDIAKLGENLAQNLKNNEISKLEPNFFERGLAVMLIATIFAPSSSYIVKNWIDIMVEQSRIYSPQEKETTPSRAVIVNLDSAFHQLNELANPRQK